jgi:hypothetical protein
VVSIVAGRRWTFPGYRFAGTSRSCSCSGVEAGANGTTAGALGAAGAGAAAGGGGAACCCATATEATIAMTELTATIKLARRTAAKDCINIGDLPYWSRRATTSHGIGGAIVFGKPYGLSDAAV